MTGPALRSAIATSRATRRPLLAFNVVDLASLQGVFDAARSVRRPVITQWSARTVALYGARLVAAAFREGIQDGAVEAFLHLDHCSDDQILAAALDAGFDGVMADGSHLSFEQNVSWTREWAVRAHALGAAIEGELGSIKGVEDGHTGGDGSGTPTPETYMTFARETAVDLLGAEIGTAHGIYTQDPAIRFDLLEALADREAPGFVVHGGSGLPQPVVRRLIAHRVAKLNYSTDLKIAWAGGIKPSIVGAGVPEPVTALRAARSAVAEMALERWRHCGEAE